MLCGVGVVFRAAGVFGFAQVGEWLKPTDCKSVPLRRYGGSNPPLCTRVMRKQRASVADEPEAVARSWRRSSDDEKEVRAVFDGLRGARRFSLDHAVGRADSSLQRERKIAHRNVIDLGIVRFSGGTVLLANPDRRRAGEREARRLRLIRGI